MSLTEFTIAQIVLHIETGRAFVIKAVGVGVIEMVELYRPGTPGVTHVAYAAMCQFRAIGRVG